jgi:hypothetical protein
MSNGMCRWIRPSELLTLEALQGMLAGGEVLEQDERGYKVVRLQTGDILKIFRVRRKISGARIYSHARRFMRNAERLQKLGLNTVTCKRLYHFVNSTDTAVLYVPLAGYTVKKLLDGHLLNQEMAMALGVFIAKLHQKGIHFRSLHMGNIVVMSDGQYGLIDISDMSIYPWPLFCNTRVRNFKHLSRYPDDIHKLGKLSWSSLLFGYFSGTNLSSNCKVKIGKHFSDVVDFDI